MGISGMSGASTDDESGGWAIHPAIGGASVSIEYPRLVSFDELLESMRTNLDDDALVAKLAVHLQRATAIESGSAEPERDEPFYDASFGAVPEVPKGPMFPELDAALARRSSRAFARLRDAWSNARRPRTLRWEMAVFA